MAIKTSNQIIFTEQKQVLNIIEWYLISDQPEGVEVNRDTMELDGWTTQVMSTTSDKPYLWNCEEVVYSIGESEISTPAIIRTYGKVSDIVNYYIVTKTADTPAVPTDLASSDWTSDFSEIQMSSTNKYLWNLEIIVYADGTTNFSKPTIAGVYGDSSVYLRIYSLNGYEFSDSVETDDNVEDIILYVDALKGSESIPDAIFTWSYYTPNETSGVEGDIMVIEDNAEDGRWVSIEGYTNTASTEFSVNINDTYAFYPLRCAMTCSELDNPIYEYRTLTKKTDIYTANIKFFDGNNVFAYGQEHIAGYVEVYKNNKLVDHPASGVMYNCTDIDTKTGNITTDYIYPTDESDPAYGIKQIYFTHHIAATDKTEEKCNIVLGEYNEADQTWNVVETQSPYIYTINDNISMASGAFIVSKNSITRSKDVNIGVFTQYLKDDNGNTLSSVDPDTLLTSISTTLIDLNDTIVGGEETMPHNPYDGQLWFNTDENALMVYKMDPDTNTGSWVHSSVQPEGKTVHVIKPSSYEKGDLWIVEDNETVISYIDAENITKDTQGMYYVFENDTYIEKKLPENYINGITYYSKFTYTAGATLKAIASSHQYNDSHWRAVNPTVIHVQNGVSQFFKFDPETGLRIGKIDQSFHVNLDATEMGFHVNNERKVHIGVESTSIKNLTVEKSADFNCKVTLDDKIEIVNTNTKNNEICPGFAWQIEDDGGFSLVKGV